MDLEVRGPQASARMLINGRALAPGEYTAEVLPALLDQAGGREAVLAAFDEVDRQPRLALWSAFRRALAENVLASTGETSWAVAIHIGGLLLTATPLAFAFSPGDGVGNLIVASAVLTVYLIGSSAWVVRWYGRFIVPAISHGADRALDAVNDFYRTLVWQLVVPGVGLYPLTVAILLLRSHAPIQAWLWWLPTALLVGAAVNWLYLTRLFQTDLVTWFSLLGLEFTSGQLKAAHEARQGTGAYLILRRWLAGRGYGALEPFQVYVLFQCILGVVGAFILLVELALLPSGAERALVGATWAIGLGSVAVSYFLRFTFFAHEAAPRNGVHGLDCPAPRTDDGDKVDVEQARAFRRVMP